MTWFCLTVSCGVCEGWVRNGCSLLKLLDLVFSALLVDKEGRERFVQLRRFVVSIWLKTILLIWPSKVACEENEC